MVHSPQYEPNKPAKCGLSVLCLEPIERGYAMKIVFDVSKTMGRIVSKDCSL
jgi:hypothetical protein